MLYSDNTKLVPIVQRISPVHNHSLANFYSQIRRDGKDLVYVEGLIYCYREGQCLAETLV